MLVTVFATLVLAYLLVKAVYSTCRTSLHNDRVGPKNISGSGPLCMIRAWKKIAWLIKTQVLGQDILEDFFSRSFAGANTIQEVSFDGSVVVSTTEPANIRAILATQFADFEIGQQRINQFYPLLGDSIFSSDGSAWEHARRLFRPQFNRNNINDLQSTERASQALLDAIIGSRKTKWTTDVELLPLLNRFTLDTATEFLFGESLNSQSLANDKKSAVSVSTQRATEQARTRQFQDDFEAVSLCLVNRVRYQSLYWLVDGWTFRSATARIRTFAEHFVQKAVDLAATGKRHGKYSLLGALAFETQDHQDLRNQTLAILAAARDTTAGFLAWSFLRLALHPDVFRRLRAAILIQFRPSDPVTEASLRSCRYLQFFLSEVLRLHPPVPVNNRRARVDTTLPTGGGPDESLPFPIAKGQVIIYSVYLMQRRKDIWGEDATEFNPARWERGASPWHFLTFSGGPRACLGQQFAMTEAGYVLVRALQEFDAIEPVDRAGMSAMKKELGLTMWPADRVRVRFHRA